MVKIKPILLLILICTLFWIISQGIVSRIDYPNSDFFSYWLAGRMILSHQNPYSSDDWITGHHLFGAEWISDPHFLYPLPLAFILLPLGLLNLYQAYVLWVWISLVILLLVILLLLPLFGENRKHYILPIASGIILFRPIVSLLLNGQISAFLLFIIVIAGLLWEKKRWVWGGMFISLTIMKPNIGVPLIALVSVYLFLRKRYQGFIGIGLAGIIMLGIAGLYNPNWIQEYLEVIKAKQALTFGFSPTIWGLAALVCQFNMTWTLLVGSFITISLFVIYIILAKKLKEITPLIGVGLSGTIALLITPYLWPYDQIILVLPILLIIVTLKNLHTSYLLHALFFIGIDIVGYVLFGISTIIEIENLNGFLPLLLLGIYIWILFKSRADNEYQPMLLPDFFAVFRQDD